ncbi:MAG: AraC family transcriptional regulator [Gammaproteobacteria bacterium]|nr:AraC family transcriptional regulator [Gammaproteobacteria bacterium]
MFYKLHKYILTFLIMVFLSFTISAAEKAPALEKQVQNLKKEVLNLNKELFILEEDLLFPANTQFSIFLSMDIGQLFDLDSVQINIDGKNIANHLYTQREINALKRGGVQRVYLGNIASGKHELVAFFTGKGPSKRDFKRGTTIEIEKTSSPLFVELKIIDNLTKQQPEFKAKVWE